MTAVLAIGSFTLRGLLGRRRAILMLLLAALPVLVGLLIRLGGGRPDVAEILDTLVVRTVLPLIALIVGTAAIGGEVEDGTLTYLLVKPVPRWRTAVTKLVVAAGLTVALVVPPMLIAAVLMAGAGSATLATAGGFALAVVVGGTAYAAAFTTLGALTSRALVIGLVYTLLWEGVLAGLLTGTRFLSIRQATLGLAAGLTGEDVGVDALAPAISAVVLVAVIAGSIWLASSALARFQVRSAD
jgi:ABC-2 type transport system permease protein